MKYKKKKNEGKNREGNYPSMQKEEIMREMHVIGTEGRERGDFSVMNLVLERWMVEDGINIETKADDSSSW